MKHISRFVLSFLLTFITVDLGLAFFGGESAILGKILVEDAQQTFKLQQIIGFASSQLSTLNKKYGFEKWINKGLDKVKDYGFLTDLKIDDYILGTFQSDMGDVGLRYKGQDYTFKNIDDWVDQVWGTAPELLNSRANLRSAVNRNDARLAYKHYIYNRKFNDKIKRNYEELMEDASQANPGEATRINAQTNSLQTVQLANLSDTQSNILKLMAIKQLERQQDEDITRFNLKQGFKGVVNIIKTIPTLGR